jgi:hypothetical protein
MSEPIPDVPDVVAARALPALVELMHTDPLARPLRSASIYSSTYFYVHRGALEISCNNAEQGGEHCRPPGRCSEGRPRPARRTPSPSSTC